MNKSKHFGCLNPYSEQYVPLGFQTFDPSERNIAGLSFAQNASFHREVTEKIKLDAFRK